MLPKLLNKLMPFTLLVGISCQASAAPKVSSAEVRASWETTWIDAQALWQQGIAGQGVTVAILDSGVNPNHFELKGRIASGGRDYVDFDNNPLDQSVDGHGTSMAGVLAANFNNKGTIGVAYQAKILPLRIVRSEGEIANAANRTKAINYATSRDDVRILLTADHPSVPDQNEIKAYQNAASHNKIIVLAAGNDTQPSPQYPASLVNGLKGAGIAVGAIGPNNELAGFSSRAGSAKKFYLVAPGFGIQAPTNASNNSFTTWAGTSMAAPTVAGAAALLLSHAPNLTNKQIVQLLLTTATDLGAPGVDDVYGRGLVNVSETLKAQGDLVAPPDEGSSSGGGSSVGAGVAAAAVGAGVIYWLTQKQKTKKQLEKTLVLDSYDRPYLVDMNKIITVRHQSPKLFDVMDMFDRQTRSLKMPLSDNLSVSMYANLQDQQDYVFLKDSNPFLEYNGQVDPEDISLKLQGDFNSLFFNVSTNQAPGSDFDRMNGQSLSNQFITGSRLANPYLGYASSADSMSLGYRFGSRYSLSIGANRINEKQSHGLHSRSSILQGTYHPNDRSSVSIQLSELTELGSLFGGASGGVFSVARASTTAVGLTTHYKLFDKLSAFANYTQGFTSVDEQRGSFLKDFTGLLSHSYSLGLLGNDLLQSHDRVGLALSSPMRVQDGNATLVVPHDIDYSTNTIYRSATRLDMADAPAELDFEAFYTMPVKRDLNVGAFFTYQDTHIDDPRYSNDAAVFATVGMKF